MTKGEYEKIGALLIKLGAVPNSKVLYKLLKSINKFKSMLSDPAEVAE